jgi:cytochrome P450
LTEVPQAHLGTRAIVQGMRSDPLTVLGRVAEECGDIGGFRLGPRRVALLNSPELVRELYVEHPQDFDRGAYQRRALRPLLGNGLLTSEGEVHGRQRAMIAPAFHHRNIGSWAEQIASIADAHRREWDDGQEIDVLAEMYRLTLGVVGSLLLSSNALREGELGRAVTRAFEWEMYALTRPLPLPLWVPTPRSLRTRAALRVLRSEIGAIIERRRRSGERPGDLLTLLLEMRDEIGARMDDQQLYDELVTLCGAAQETSADAMAWALYLLSRHPDVAQRLRDELDAVLGGRLPTDDDLASLPLALAVFKETLRVYPPAAVILRGAVRDTTLGGMRIRRGTMVLVSPFLLHRRPDAFPAPEQFDPDRFLRANERSLPKFAFLPFGAGHHVCIGASLALMEGQVLVATLMQRAQLELLSGLPVAHKLVVNLRPAEPIRARVCLRNPAPVML